MDIENIDILEEADMVTMVDRVKQIDLKDILVKVKFMDIWGRVIYWCFL